MVIKTQSFQVVRFIISNFNDIYLFHMLDLFFLCSIKKKILAKANILSN